MLARLPRNDERGKAVGWDALILVMMADIEVWRVQIPAYWPRSSK